MAVNHKTLWMGDLQPHMNENFIIQAFRYMGENVVNVKVIRDKVSGAPAGYCFVEFPDREVAHNAMLRLNGKGIPGSKPHKLFKLNHASFGREHLLIPEYSLYVGELTRDVDDLALYRAFASRYSSVKAAKVVIDSNGAGHKGFGFVRFRSEEEQQLALIEMQNFTKLGSKPIRVSLAVPKRMQASLAQSSIPHSFHSQQQGTSYNSQYYQQYSQVPAPYSYTNNPQNKWGWGQYPDYYNTMGGYNAPGVTDPASTQEAQYGHGGSHSEEASSINMDDETLEDPEIEIDVEKANKEYMERSEELYLALEGSRWHPLDNVFSQITSNTSVVKN